MSPENYSRSSDISTFCHSRRLPYSSSVPTYCWVLSACAWNGIWTHNLLSFIKHGIVNLGILCCPCCALCAFLYNMYVPVCAVRFNIAKLGTTTWLQQSTGGQHSLVTAVRVAKRWSKTGQQFDYMKCSKLGSLVWLLQLMKHDCTAQFGYMNWCTKARRHSLVTVKARQHNLVTWIDIPKVGCTVWLHEATKARQHSLVTWIDVPKLGSTF